MQRLEVSGAVPPICGSLGVKQLILVWDELHSKQISPVRGLEWPRGFQEVKAPSFHDNGTGWW